MHAQFKPCISASVSDSNTTSEAVRDPQPLVADQTSAPAAAHPVKLTLVSSLDIVKTEGDEEFPFVTGLDFMADGRIVAVDNENKKCFIMNADLQRLGTAFKFESAPCDVTCYKENTLAVTLELVQKILHTSYLKQLSSRCSKNKN